MIIAKKIFYSIFISVAFLISCGNENNKNTKTNHPVFSIDIAPIVYKHCTPCHRDGSGAPFNFVTYDDVRKRLQTFMLAVNSRTMPPWPADTSYRHFLGEKVISKDEMFLLNSWFKDGAPEGDRTLTPSPPEFFNGSRFGKPDMILSIRDRIKLEGNNKDHFLMLKIPYTLSKDTFIKAIEIIPDNKKLVHHINAHLIQYNAGAKSNFTKGEKFVDTEKMNKQEAFKKLDLANDDGTYPLLTPSVTNYLPGVETAIYPDGIGGYRVKKDGALLLDNIHYGPSPVDTSDQTSFNIFFDSKAPQRPVKEMILGTSGIAPVEPQLVIPPNAIRKFITRYTLPVDISLLTINPHMHLLGSSFKAYALSEHGDTIRLINIPKWDFRWQYFYTFEKIIHLPSGTELVAEGVYDNTENNPNIPFHPPQTISEREGSMRTTDEMFQLICTYIPYKAGDENISLKPDLK